MQLSIKELNEIIYCMGRVIAQNDEFNKELRQQVFNKLYYELEKRNNLVVEEMRKHQFVPLDELIEELHSLNQLNKTV